MATKKPTTSSSTAFRIKPKKSRAGIHSKTKMSKNKHSKNYIKRNVGQG